MTPEQLAAKLREIVDRYSTALWPVDIEALNAAATALDCLPRPDESEADYVNRLLDMMRNRK